LEELGDEVVNQSRLQQGYGSALGVTDDIDTEAKLDLAKVRYRPFGTQLTLEEIIRRRVACCCHHVIDVNRDEVRRPVSDPDVNTLLTRQVSESPFKHCLV
jgi:hypothetical protein